MGEVGGAVSLPVLILALPGPVLPCPVLLGLVHLPWTDEGLVSRLCGEEQACVFGEAGRVRSPSQS